MSLGEWEHNKYTIGYLKPHCKNVKKNRHWLEVALIFFFFFFLINKIKGRLMQARVNLVWHNSQLNLVERDSLLEFKTSSYCRLYTSQNMLRIILQCHVRTSSQMCFQISCTVVLENYPDILSKTFSASPFYTFQNMHRSMGSPRIL